MNNRNLLTIVAVVTLGTLGWWYLRPGGAMAPMEHMGGDVGLSNAMSSTAMDGISEGAMIVDPVLPSQLSDQAQMGKRGFEAKCAACHGENAGGIKGTAPPLVHKIYEPSHHADFAFLRAVQNGVRAHHWPFGDMAPVEGLTEADVGAIVAYVRALQQANGIN